MVASLAVGNGTTTTSTGSLSGGFTVPADGFSDFAGIGSATTPPSRPTLAARRQARRRQNAPNAPEEVPAPPPEPGETLVFESQTVQQPRAGVSVNGVRIDRLLIELDVTNNRFFSADSFRCTLVLEDSDPDFGMEFWSNADRLDMEFFFGFGVDEPPSVSVLSGRVDELQIDLDARQLQISGRDYTADLIEKQIVEKYPNKTSSEIIKILAESVGLTAVVTETSALAGVYYRNEHAQLADETTAWNLATFLAEREGFDVYVKGKELIFAPPPDPITAKKWVLNYEAPEVDGASPEAPVSTLQLTRSLTVSRDITVKVVSWNSSKKYSLTATSRSKRPPRSSNGKGGGSAGGQTQAITHVFRVPNLTQDQAEALALQRAREIAQHLRSFEAELPGDPNIDMRTIVTIKGTGGSFDTNYHLVDIQRGMSQSRGFTMRLAGRNVTPSDTATI